MPVPQMLRRLSQVVELVESVGEDDHQPAAADPLGEGVKNAC